MGIETKKDGIVHIRIRVNENGIKEVNNNMNRNMNIVMVCNSKYGKDIGMIIERIAEEYGNERLIIGGDFNIRIGELGGEEEEWEIIRRSKDKTIENGGKRFMDKILGRLSILNGKMERDWEGEFT